MAGKTKKQAKKSPAQTMPENMLPQNILVVGERMEEDKNIYISQPVYRQIVHREIDKKHRDKKIVGWIHTHPDFGIFLSEYDKFIQQNFFGEADQEVFSVHQQILTQTMAGMQAELWELTAEEEELAQESGEVEDGSGF